MKKNNFVEGAFISTLGIVICKIIGILYVIPFRAIVGVEGAILYSYAYTIYAVFAALSSTGIPSTMAKTISEYNTLEYYDAQRRAYKLSRNIIISLGTLMFLILFIFAPQISYLIIGDIEGGNTIEDITFVIRIISTALLVIPILSSLKGYLQGLRIMKEPAVANVIEQLIRVIVILVGSFVTLKLLNLSVTTAVGVAVFGATAGAIAAYLYLIKKINKQKKFPDNYKITKEEKKLTNEKIIKKIVKYSLPFILIEVIRSAYNTIDIFTTVRTLVDLGISVTDAEITLSVITTWGSKLNMIILSITFGLAMSIIPNIVRSATLNDYKDVDKKIKQSLKIVLFTSLPMTIGLFFLSSSVWTIFYGYDQLSVQVFSFFILQAITSAFYFILVDTTNALSKSKTAILTLLICFLAKGLFNIPMMYLLDYININPVYAPTLTTMLVQTSGTIFLLKYLKKTYDLNYKSLIKSFIKIILITAIMFTVLALIRLVVGDFPTTRLYAFLEIILYSIVGGTVYIYLSFKHNLFNSVFGKENVENMLKKFKRGK